LESIVRKHKVQSLEAQLALSQNVCSSLAQEFKTESLTDEQKAAIGHRLNAALKENDALQLAIDLLETQDREEQVYY
jgi:hypothetical protein